jgi:hypothetical protein
MLRDEPFKRGAVDLCSEIPGGIVRNLVLRAGSLTIDLETIVEHDRQLRLGCTSLAR